MKKIISLIIILIGVIILCFVMIKEKQQKDMVINDLKMEVVGVKTEVVDLEKKLKGLENEISDLKKQIDSYKDLVEMYEQMETNLNEQIKILEKEVSSRGDIYTVTAYDLSVQSCGKEVGSYGYGITASGKSLVGQSWSDARAIAVDTKVIPMGSKVRINFTNKSYQKYNGVYTAVDTGGAVNGKTIDIFLGDFKQAKAHQSVWNFGRTEAKVQIL